MKHDLLIAVLCVNFICGCACTSTEHRARKKNDENEAWLQAERIESAVMEQTRELRKDPQQYPALVRSFYELQGRADLVIELWDSLRIVKSKGQGALPKGPFPVGDLGRYLSRASASKPIDLVVVVLPDPFKIQEDAEPSQLQLIRAIDRTLRGAAVKRRVFQSIGNMHYVELDSAELDKPKAHRP